MTWNSGPGGPSVFMPGTSPVRCFSRNLLRMKPMNCSSVLLRVLPGLILAAAAAPLAAQTQDPAAVAAWETALRETPQDKPADPAAAKQAATQSTVQDRGNLRDEQEPAPRLGNQAVNPK